MVSENACGDRAPSDRLGQHRDFAALTKLNSKKEKKQAREAAPFRSRPWTVTDTKLLPGGLPSLRNRNDGIDRRPLTRLSSSRRAIDGRVQGNGRVAVAACFTEPEVSIVASSALFA